MAQYNTLNVKLSNSQLNKIKSAIKNGTGVTLNLSSNLIGNSIDESNFPYKLLLTSSKIRKTFANGSSTNIAFSKTQLSKIALYDITGPLIRRLCLLPKSIIK